MFTDFDWSPQVLVPLLLATIAAGLVRGFAGFGAGLILMPVASAVIDPRLAAVAFLTADAIFTLPMVPPAVRKCHWPTVLPTAIGALCIVPLGAWVLINSDVLVLRWGIPILILGMLVLLLSGWRYHGAPKWPTSLAIGGLSGFFGGVAQIAGPPVVAYWMAEPLPTQIIRANLITFFAIVTVGSAISYYVGGLFTWKVAEIVLVVAPTYMLTLWLGTRGFSRANESQYRRIAYGLIAFAALTSLPVLDGVLRG